MTDEELVREFRRGSKEAFSELVRRHSRPLTMMILRLIRDEEEARDISQKVFLKAYEGLPRFMMASSFKTWLYSIAVNAVRDHQRKRNPTTLTDEVDMAPDSSKSPAQQLETASALQEVRKALGELPHKQRITLQLRIYEGMDYKQIARILGGSEGAARANFCQAIKTLREKLDREA
jgi:RNA polymerase sigma-70 factor (ECF subfamily)